VLKTTRVAVAAITQKYGHSQSDFTIELSAALVTCSSRAGAGPSC
jgi:hypothetical protein